MDYERYLGQSVGLLAIVNLCIKYEIPFGKYILCFRKNSVNYFLNPFDSRLILMVLYDSLNLVINAFSSGLLGSTVHEKGIVIEDNYTPVWE